MSALNSFLVKCCGLDGRLLWLQNDSGASLFASYSDAKLIPLCSVFKSQSATCDNVTEQKRLWRKREERQVCGQRGGTEGGYIWWWTLSWPGLASVWLYYVELIWRLHSVCQVSAAIIMQLWAFILSRPTAHPPNLPSSSLQQNASIRCFSFFPFSSCLTTDVLLVFNPLCVARRSNALNLTLIFIFLLCANSCGVSEAGQKATVGSFSSFEPPRSLMCSN